MSNWEIVRNGKKVLFEADKSRGLIRLKLNRDLTVIFDAAEYFGLLPNPLPSSPPNEQKRKPHRANNHHRRATT